MSDVEFGLRSLAEEVRAREINSIAIPPLACGIGGLNWSELRPRIEESLREFSDLRVVIMNRVQN